MNLSEQIRTLASRPQGFHSSDLLLTGRSTTQLGNAANQLVRRGQLFKASLHRTESRYFATPEAREAYIVAHKPRANTKRTGLMWRAAGAAPWAADAKPVVTERTVFTRCPSAPPRFREHTFAFVHGSR
jgi:hypothetical protein